MRRRVDEREVVTEQLPEAGRTARRGRRGHVALAKGERHAVIAPRVQAEHRDRQRYRGHRVGEAVLRGHLVRTAAHQVEGRPVADPLPRAVRQREHAGLRHHPGHRHLRARARRSRGQLTPPRRPRREVTARAVPDRHNPFCIDWQAGQQVNPRRHILERPRPAAPGQRPPVFQVPRRIPAPRQVRRQRPPERQVIPGPPEPPVYHHHGPQRLPVRQPQLPELTGVRPVRVHNRLRRRLASLHAGLLFRVIGRVRPAVTIAVRLRVTRPLRVTRTHPRPRERPGSTAAC